MSGGDGSALKGKYFSVSGKRSLLSRRFERLKNFNRVPITLLTSLFFFYFKKLLGDKGTKEENANNYYFLTLINSDCYTIAISDSDYIFHNKGGIKFKARRNPSSDLEVFNQVWGRDDYEKATQLINNTDRNLTILDAGSNVGYTSLFFHQKFPRALIVSVEPDEDNFNCLKENIKLNSTNRILPLKAGIWSHRCNVMVDKSFRDNREWSYQVKEASDPTGLVGMHILDIIDDFKIDRIDLLKIDIEGAERYLFASREKARELLSRVDVLALEIHDEEVSREYIYELLLENNFIYFDYSDLTIAHRRKDPLI